MANEKGNLCSTCTHTLHRRKINFIHSRVDKIIAGEKSLDLMNGMTIDYDYLVIDTGPRLLFEEVPGNGPDGLTTSTCTTEHAVNTRAAYEKLFENPAPVVIGVMPFASCFGPAYERVYRSFI